MCACSGASWITTFQAVDLQGRAPARATAVLRVRPTGYEAEDLLELYVTDGGTGRVDLLRLNGDTGLDGLADDRYAA